MIAHLKHRTVLATLTAGFVLGAGFGLTGCAAATDESTTESSASPSTPTPSVTPDYEAEIAAEEAMLPMPPNEIRAWAATAVPTAGSEGYQYAYSGWLSEHTSKNFVSSYESLAPGAYVAQLACRGEGTITVTMSALDEEAVGAGPQSCSNSTVAFDVTTTTTGLRSTLSLDGAPTIYAVSIQSAPTAD